MSRPVCEARYDSGNRNYKESHAGNTWNGSARRQDLIHMVSQDAIFVLTDSSEWIMKRVKDVL